MVRRFLSKFGRQRREAKYASRGKRKRSTFRNLNYVDLRYELLEDRRMLAAGDLATTFNPGGVTPGILVSDRGFTEGTNLDSMGVAVQADGKIVVAGTVQFAAGQATKVFGVARY